MAITCLSPVRVNPLLVHPEERRLSLDGEWRFALDERDSGIPERWFEDPERFEAPIQVPGCWQGQGFGHDGAETVWDFRFQTRVFRATYTGTGWYCRRFQAPSPWHGRRVWLAFGGVHPSADVWLNGVAIGGNDLPFAPFGFDVTDALRWGADNWVVARVHEANRAFGFAYNWQGNWSGLYRGVDLVATGESYLEWSSLLPNLDAERLDVDARIGGAPQRDMVLRISVAAADGHGSAVYSEVPVTGNRAACSIPVPSPLRWSPDSPALYRVDLALCSGGTVLDAQSERTGFVKLSTRDKHFLINGEPTYMRGTGDFLSCPETGCPDTDRDRWRRKLRALRDYGYNHVRCQSYVYAPEYFDAADEVGMLVQSEMGMLGAWSGHTKDHVYQWPQPTPDNYPTLKRQWDLVVQRDVNHPSANLYCMSNEFGERLDYPRIAWECHRDTRAIKPSAFVIWTDGGYRADAPGEFVNADERSDAEIDKPLIAHEFRWWSSFPDVRLAGKYDGAVRPYAIEIAREAAQRHGLAHLLPVFAANSQRLQLLEAKGKMEMLRRDFPRLAGISHFNAMDANPSPQGVVDEFYQNKLADASEWLQTNGDTVVLSSLGFDQRVVEAGATFDCALSVSDFSHPPLHAPLLDWRLLGGDEVLDSGRITYEHEAYRTCPAGTAHFRTPVCESPIVARLEATLAEGDRRVTNAWTVWLVPHTDACPTGAAVYGPADHTWLRHWRALPGAELDRPMPDGVRVAATERLDGQLVAWMRAGGSVVLAAGEGLVRPHAPNFGYVRYFFTPPANYAPYEDGQNGTVIQSHPMLGDLPHEGFADLQFFRVMEDAPPLDLEPLGLADGGPVIRVIHRYPVCRPLGYLVERRVGRGLLIVCALGLDPALPEARWIFGRMCAYAMEPMATNAPELDDDALKRLMQVSSLPAPGPHDV